MSYDVGNFYANEQVGFWLTDPYEDVVLGTNKTLNIGSEGAQYGLEFDTSDLYSGQSFCFLILGNNRITLVFEFTDYWLLSIPLLI